MSYTELTCPICNNKFLKQNRHVNEAKKLGHTSTCSIVCQSKFRTTSINFNCKQCLKPSKRTLSQVKKVKNLFCSSSCAALYNNANKKFGTRVSKIEKHIQEKLFNHFKDLEFHFNRKDAIKSELDIFIPELKIAFELNGIYHYEPIHGVEKLLKVKTNDYKKLQSCIENQIVLYSINISQVKFFKPEFAEKYFSEIKNIVQENLANQN